MSPPGAAAQFKPLPQAVSGPVQTIEVRTCDGELIRTVTPASATAILQAQVNGRPIAEQAGNNGHIRLMPGIRWIPKLDFSNGLPDLTAMRVREPERYAETWRGAEEPHIGHGAIGRSRPDRTVHLSPDLLAAQTEKKA